MNGKHIIQRLLGEPPTPKPEVTARARAQLNNAIRTSRPGLRQYVRPRRVLGVAGLAAITAAAVIVVPSIATNGADPGLPRSPGAGDDTSHAAEPLSAKEILLMAADRAEQQDEATKSGRYWRVREYGRGVLEWLKVGEKGDKYHITSPTIEETWVGREAKDGTWSGDRDSGYEPATRDDWAAWKRDSAPRKWNLGPADTVDQDDYIVTMKPSKPYLDRWGKGNRFLPYDSQALTYDELRKLPTEAEALTEYLLELQKETDVTSEPDQWVFSVASDLLMSAPAPADVRAAAFRAIADLPSVHNLGPTEDPLGREGVALAIVARGDGFEATTKLIIDEESGQLLATQLIGPKSGTTTTLSAEWTNEKPHVPSASDFPDIPIPD